MSAVSFIIQVAHRPEFLVRKRRTKPVWAGASCFWWLYWLARQV